jgi:hypothetical protein
VPFAEELLVAVGVPASELQRSSGQVPCFSDERVHEGISYSITSGTYMWQHHCKVLSQKQTKSREDSSSSSSSGGGGARGCQSSSDNMPPAVPQLQQLLQHWPAVLVELLLLVDEAWLKMLLLQSLLYMLQTPIHIQSSGVDPVDINSRVIGPLLQLALPHVQQVIKQLRETTTSSSSSSSTHGASSSSSGTGSSSTLSAIDADLFERVWHSVLLESTDVSAGTTTFNILLMNCKQHAYHSKPTSVHRFISLQNAVTLHMLRFICSI